MCFFFFKQKTAYELRISDWSSDVCSSDLFGTRVDQMPRLATGLLDEQHQPDDLDAAAGTAGTAAEERDQHQQQRGEQWPAARVGDCKTGAGAIRDDREQTFADGAAQRSEERRVGQGGVRTGRSGWATEH